MPLSTLIPHAHFELEPPMLRPRAAVPIVALLFAAACADGGTGPTTSRTAADVSAAASHPVGTLVARTPIPSAGFGLAVSQATGAVLVTELGSNAMGRINLPAFGVANQITVSSGPTNVAFNSTGKGAFVTNQLSNSVGFVNLTTNIQVRDVPVGVSTFNVVVSPDNKTLYVSNNGSAVLVMDVATRTVRTAIPVGNVSNGMALNKNGTRLYVSLVTSGQVAEVNTLTDSVTRTFATGGVPQDLVVANGVLYIANESGTLDAWNLSTGMPIGSTPIGCGGFGMARSPDGVQLYISQPGCGTVTVADRASRAVVGSIVTGGTPRKIGFNSSGTTAAIANEGGWVDFVQ
jgi:YVTN family beta-propeller protein